MSKDGRYDDSPEVKPNRLDRHLVAGCSIGHKSSMLADGTCGKLKDILKDGFHDFI